MGLFPVFSVPSTLTEDKNTGEQYRPSPAFDVETGEFVLDGGGKLSYGSGYDAWVLWCVKTIQTQRWAHLGYRSNIGTEIAQAFALWDRSAQESFLERTVTEALLSDPKQRTVRVYDFSYVWGEDSVALTCTIFGQKGDTASISVNL